MFFAKLWPPRLTRIAWIACSAIDGHAKGHGYGHGHAKGHGYGHGQGVRSWKLGTCPYADRQGADHDCDGNTYTAIAPAPPLELLTSQQDFVTHHVAPFSRGSFGYLWSRP